VQGDNKKNAVICFCNSNLAWGGGEKWHLDSAIYFAGLGYRVILAANPKGRLWLNAQNKPELELSSWDIGNLSYLNPFKKVAFTRFLAESRVSHLILNMPADFKLGARAACKIQRVLPIKVYYRRGSAIPVRPSFGNRTLFNGLTAVIANSEETAACVRQSNLIDPSRIRVIYNGLDINNFDARLDAAKALLPAVNAKAAEVISTDHPFIIGNAGRLSRQKSQHYLLYMSASLKHKAFPHRLFIAGDGELLADLLALAKGLNLAFTNGQGVTPDKGADVCFTGFLQDLFLFWNSIDLFVLSSIWEGFGYVLAEAMLARKPLLAFNCNSMPELVKDGQNGVLLTAPGQNESAQVVGERLAEQVIAMSAKLPALQAMGEAGRKFCLQNFDQKNAMQKLEDLLF
jgi:glycosyltransferase involved in cell wall biosynthesis